MENFIFTVTRLVVKDSSHSASPLDGRVGHSERGAGLNHLAFTLSYPRTAGVLFEAYATWVAGNNSFDTQLFHAADLAGTHHLGLWTNLEGVVGKWWNSTSSWVANQSIS